MIETVSKLPGHARPEMTIRHYGHIDTGLGRDAVAAL